MPTLSASCSYCYSSEFDIEAFSSKRHRNVGNALERARRVNLRLGRTTSKYKIKKTHSVVKLSKESLKEISISFAVTYLSKAFDSPGFDLEGKAFRKITGGGEGPCPESSWLTRCCR